ncbi:leucine-rich repeat protein [Segatella copri]
MPDSVNIIPAGCFNGCIELTKVELPSTITKISNDAFSK